MIYVAFIGATLIITRGTIFDFAQRRWSFFKCSQCVGFWVGTIGGACGIVTMGHGHALDAFLAGTATSFLSLGSDAILLRLLGDPDEP